MQFELCYIDRYTLLFNSIFTNLKDACIYLWRPLHTNKHIIANTITGCDKALCDGSNLQVRHTYHHLPICCMLKVGCP